MINYTIILFLMRIYFTASIVGKKYHLPNYLKIIGIVKKDNHQIIEEHIIQGSESQIKQENKNERLKFQSQLDKWINNCDCMIAETSFPSISVGYEISLALSRGKPVLILYSSGNAPTLLAHHRDDKLVCEKYTADTLEDIIKDFLNYVQGANDMRFTFFITSEIASYLDKISRNKKIPKSVYLRRLIEKEMQK